MGAGRRDGAACGSSDGRPDDVLGLLVSVEACEDGPPLLRGCAGGRTKLNCDFGKPVDSKENYRNQSLALRTDHDVYLERLR